ncbi:DUF4105 domain-containing protein [Croceivirga thetidis]|uniref:DUF4105 domain-containing protein n=1 Tax=Croceivirga thetidis TaxID=2721623 RepID=A0ABX1GSE5_9FLAO|nr:DUF4105 domain-containing protein [Croceivirga thetidis]NKI32874.1 DUF4105 domain-containing protein [Croceivirga thetidis]
MGKRFFLIVFFLAQLFAYSQVPKLSDKAEISVMTCAGDPSVLYYAFGHTAFRVHDPIRGIDVVYNYGTFDFGQPNFYLNFTKGRLLYSLSRSSFERFSFTYEMEGRWVRQQVLNLTPEETNQVFQFFESNFLPENREYLYDPLFDNCSTVMAKILTENFGDEILFEPPKDETLTKEKSAQPTFRDLVKSHLQTNSWGDFGINLAFGAVVDRKATLRERIFLPYQAMYQVRAAKKDGKPLLRKEEIVVDLPEIKDNSSFFTTPCFVFLLLLAFIAWITFKDHRNSYHRKWLDFSLLFISGFIGLFLMVLWFATDHVYTKSNWNVLWLLPVNMIMAFVVVRKNLMPVWFKKYLWLAIGLMGLTIMLWIFKVQVFSPLNLILMTILSVRYWFMLKFKSA